MDTRLLLCSALWLVAGLSLTLVTAKEVDVRGDDEETESAGNCEFSVGARHSLYGHNDKSLGSRDLQYCLKECAEREECMSVTRHSVKGNCFLSFASKNTHPNDYRPHNKKNYYHKEICEESSGDNVCIEADGPHGGYGGTAFSDEYIFNLNHGKISKIQVRHGRSIDCIGMTYGRGDGAIEGECHGGDGGYNDVIELQSNEYVTRVDGWSGDVIDHLVIHTNLKTYGDYGIGGDKKFRAGGNGRRLAYISGTAGDLLDRLTFHFFC